MQQTEIHREELIRSRAYQFWLEEGRPEGRAHIHWQRAVESLTADTIPDITPVAAPAVEKPAAKAKAPAKAAAKTPAKTLAKAAPKAAKAPARTR